MKAMLLRMKWWALGLLTAASVVTVFAQEPQVFNRGITVIQGNITAAGTGYVFSCGSVVRDFRTLQSITGASATYTAAQILAGSIARTTSGGNVTDVLPAAATLTAAIPGAIVGESFELWIDPGTSPGGTITLNGASAGVTYAGDCGTSSSEKVIHVLINITAVATPAYRATCMLSS